MRVTQLGSDDARAIRGAMLSLLTSGKTGTFANPVAGIEYHGLTC